MAITNTQDGVTALHCASQNGQLDIVKIFAEKKDMQVDVPAKVQEYAISSSVLCDMLKLL